MPRLPRELPSANRLIIFFVSTLCGAAVLLALVLHESYREAERQAEADARNLAMVIEARMLGVFRRAHAGLDELAASLPVDALKDGSGARYREPVSRMLTMHSAYFPELQGFRVLDARGDLLFASDSVIRSGNAGEADYFRLLKAKPETSFVFSRETGTRLTGKEALVMAVPIREASGHFLGVALAMLDLGEIKHLFDSMTLGEKGELLLLRSDDAGVVLRRPAAAANLTAGRLADPGLHQMVRAGGTGTLRVKAAVDGVERLTAYRALGNYPFYVSTGIAVEDFLAGWWRMAVLVALSALVLILALAFGLIRLLRVEREEAQIASCLGESEARYRMLAENSHDVIWTLDIPSRKFTYISPSVEQLRGYTVEEAMSQTLAASLTSASAELAAAEIDQHLRRIAAGDPAARVVTQEMEQLRKDGSVVATEVVTTYLLDAGGVPRTILGISRDISERKEAELALLESNAKLQARIEEIGRLQVALQELAIRDGLTGLYNRRYLDETLEREVSRARREGSPLSLVMLDIDHFKQVNDTYGHQVGDEVLRMLAKTLLADTRAEDVACRYGGEEFLILLPHMPLGAALNRAEVWRQSVESLSIVHGNFAIRFTISLGVSAYPEHGKTPDDLTGCADLALYRAKREGRNRVANFLA